MYQQSFLNHVSQTSVISNSPGPHFTKTDIVIHLRTEDYSKCFVSINFCNSHSNTKKLELFSFSFTDEETEAWRISLPNLI